MRRSRTTRLYDLRDIGAIIGTVHDINDSPLGFYKLNNRDGGSDEEGCHVSEIYNSSYK